MKQRNIIPYPVSLDMRSFVALSARSLITSLVSPKKCIKTLITLTMKGSNTLPKTSRKQVTRSRIDSFC